MVLMRLLIFIIFPLICLINNLSYSNNNVIGDNIELIQKDLIGTELTYVIKDKDTLINIARKYGISFADILSANGNMDPWLPKVDKKILIPKKHILPRAKRNGIVINLGDLRIYFFDRDKFKDALNLMMENHDACIGINWEVIEHYLVQHCRINS